MHELSDAAGEGREGEDERLVGYFKCVCVRGGHTCRCCSIPAAVAARKGGGRGKARGLVQVCVCAGGGIPAAVAAYLPLLQQGVEALGCTFYFLTTVACKAAYTSSGY